jgi:hypothetical protein
MMYTPLPVLLRILNAVRWLICQLTRPNGGRDAQATPCVRSWRETHSRSLGRSSIPSLGDGVMLGTAWIDRPVDTQGCAPCFHVLLERPHGSAAMLKPMIDIPLASLRCLPEALPGRPEAADTFAAA